MSPPIFRHVRFVHANFELIKCSSLIDRCFAHTLFDYTAWKYTYAKRAALNVNKAWVVVANTVDLKPEGLKEALCAQLEIPETQFNALAKGSND